MIDRSRLKFVGVVVAAVGLFFVLYKTEPLGPETCTEVQVVDVVKCSRGSECFVFTPAVVVGRNTVTTSVDKPFSENYRGSAGLLVRRGQWLHSIRYRFVTSCEAVDGAKKTQGNAV
ncbi:MAG: hypothetical protein QM718_09995 [Steroidobacteraceae bacterium]